MVCGLRTLSAPWGEGALPAKLGEDGEGWVGEGALPAQGGLPGHLHRDGYQGGGKLVVSTSTGSYINTLYNHEF